MAFSRSPQLRGDFREHGKGSDLCGLRAFAAAEKNEMGTHWEQFMEEEGSKYNNAGDIMHKITLARKSTKLDLSKMGLCDPLPREVYMIYYLKQLLLEGNTLITVSPLIGNPYLNGLMQLNLSNNCLKEIPEEICCLVQMRFLNLDHNQVLHSSHTHPPA